jgi:hypothetical protein
MYLISGHGITVGYHRLFTHRSSMPPGGCDSRWPSPGA